MTVCRNCANDDGGDGPSESDHCGHCPPWRCDECGEMSSATRLCSCWISLTDMPLADIKALFSDDCDGPGFSLDPARGATS